MDFAAALETVTSFLDEKGYSHAVIGGVALAAYGMLRTTLDLDFVVEGRAQEELIAHLEALGYQNRPGPRGLGVRLPKPEHLAALKVFALKNDPGRTFQEMADIRFLLQVPGVSRPEVRQYFARQGLEERFDEIERTLP